jgi:hypothetical protein
VERPEIPENIESLSLSELRELLAALKPFADEALSADEPDLELLEAFAAAGERVLELAAAEARTKELRDRAAAAASAMAADEEGSDDEGGEPEVEEAEAEDDEGEEPEVEEADDEAATETEELADETLDHSADEAEDGEADMSDNGTETEESEVDKPSTDDLSGDTNTTEVETPGVVSTARVLPGVPGFEANAPIDSRLDVAKALAAKWQTVAESGTGERFAVVTIKAEYPDFADFSDGDVSGLYDDAIVAACAPLEPYYGVGFYSSEARPVFGSMPKFNAPRGGVKIYASPRFSENLIPADTGFGQWTYTDDNNPSAEKNDCYDFVCGDTTDYQVYGTYRCMNIRNLDAITFPELVAAHQNQLGSKWARYADKLLLDAMVATADIAVHASATYGATRTILSRMDQIAAQYREKERLDDTPVLDIWLPRWIKNALREDVIRAANDSGVPEVVVDATIASWFEDIGLVPHFTFDNPTSAGDLTPQGAGVVNAWPDTTWYILSVRGNLGILDLGSINIGVSPNGSYRDSTLTKRNRFQMFMESFEGLVNRGAPVWRGEVTVLANGAQPAGVTAISDNATV